MADLLSAFSVCILLFVVSFFECWAFRSIQHQCHHQKGSNFASSTVWRAASLQKENEPAAAAAAFPRVLCIGEALFDCIADFSARGLNVQEMVASKKWTAFPGGATANVAAACSKLGTRSAFAGCVGNDDMGQELIQILGTKYGVDVSLVQQSTASRYPTRRVMVTRDMTGDRAFGAFYQDRAADDFADAHLDADVLLEKTEPLFQQLEHQHDNGDDSSHHTLWMVCGTLSLAYPESAKAIRRIVHRGKQTGAGSCRLLVDVNWRPVFWKCDNNIADENSVAIEKDARRQILDFCQQQADVIKLTDEEAEWLLGIPAATSLEKPSLVADAFPKAFAVLVTAGEQGASYSMWGITGRLDAAAMIDSSKVVETTGAGDAFTAGFLHQLLQLDLAKAAKMPLDKRAVLVEDLIRFASITGGLTCTAEGAMAAQPTLTEVESYMVMYGINQ